MKKWRFCFFLLILLGMAGMAACKKKIKKPERNLIFRKFQLDRELLSRAPGAPFAVSDLGEVYLAEDGGICRYGMDGELLGSISTDGKVTALCLGGTGCFFTRLTRTGCAGLLPKAARRQSWRRGSDVWR